MAVELNIFDIIGGWDSLSPDEVEKALKVAGGQDVTINVASAGGSIIAGLIIAGLIAKYSGKTIGNGIGLIASAATIVLLGCKEKLMDKNSLFMIHNSWGGSDGGAEDMEKSAEVLRKIDLLMANIYVSQIESKGKLVDGSKEKTLAKVKKMMQEETWLTADEALELGFIDGIMEQNKETSIIQEQAFAWVRAEATNFKHIPKQIQSMEKKTLLQQMASWLGLKADITDEAEIKTEAVKSEVTPEEEPKAEQVTDGKVALEAELETLKKQIEEKQKQLDGIEAELKAKISYKAEPKAEKAQELGFTQEQIAQASVFINSLIK